MGTWESELSMGIVTKGAFTLAGADGNSNGVPPNQIGCIFYKDFVLEKCILLSTFKRLRT